MALTTTAAASEVRRLVDGNFPSSTMVNTPTATTVAMRTTIGKLGGNTSEAKAEPKPTAIADSITSTIRSGCDQSAPLASFKPNVCFESERNRQTANPAKERTMTKRARKPR
jgi:hypothetical protein